MNLSSYLVERVARLGPPQTRDLTMQPDLRVPMPDGTILLADRWAVADSLPPEVKAMIPHVTESALTLEFLRKDGLTLETPLRWGVLVAGQERRGAMLRALAHRSARSAAGMTSSCPASSATSRRCSRPATGSGSRFPAAPSRATPATLGTGEPLPNATTLRVADQEVHHDPGHASAVVLPVG